MSGPIIRAAGLTRRFGDFVAVDALDLAVEPGTLFAFLGANGSGKSTTIRMLIGLLTPSEGSVQVDGVDVIREPRRVRERIGYMGQKVSLYQGLSVRENAEFYAGLYGLRGTEAEARWHEVREQFALRESEAEHPENLPAGLRQRAGLALATLHRPRVLFLDEPTAGVDVHSRGLFWERIQEQAEAGVTVFVTTHFLEEADFCDWVTFIDAGRLIANATPAELRARYSEGYRIHLGGAAARLDDAALARLRVAGFRPEGAEGGAALVHATLDAPALAALREQLGEADADALRIEEPSMDDVFRQVMQSATEPAKEAA